jgi:hypothetical protein
VRSWLLTSRSALAGLAFGLTLLVGRASLLRNQQLGSRFVVDEWFALGVNLRAYGTIGLGSLPTLRPPAYPVLIAGALLPLGKPSEVAFPKVFPWSSDLAGFAMPFDPSYLERGARATYLVQCILLAASAALMYSWLCLWLRPGLAFACAVLFGTNPYSVILTGTLSYPVLHIFTLILSCFALELALGASARHLAWMFIAGVCLGLATLVRPVTLLVPPFLLGAFFLRTGFSWRAALRDTLAVLLGLGVTGRIIPVSAQAWETIWGSTVQPRGRNPNYFTWKQVRSLHLPIYSRVTGDSEYKYSSFVRYKMPIEDAFEAEALKNIRERPDVYLRNVLTSLLTEILDIDSVRVRLFQYIQRGDVMPRNWYLVGHSQDFYPPRSSREFLILIGVLTALSGAGLLVALRRRNPALLPPLLTFLCIAFAQCLIWMDMGYYYFKLPFLFVFAFSFIDEMWGGVLGAVLLGFLAALSVHLTASVLF